MPSARSARAQRRGGRSRRRNSTWGSGLRPLTIWKRGKKRDLLVPKTRSGKTICAAIHAELSPQVEPLLADNVYGFRSKRSRFGAAQHARSLTGEHRMAVDVVNFFSSIDRDHYRGLDVFPRGIWSRMKPYVPPSGLAQGPSFSPVLSNLYLAEIDHEFPNVIRYADDLLIVSDDPFEVRDRLAARLESVGLELHDDYELNPKSWLSVDLQTLKCVAPPPSRIVFDRGGPRPRFLRVYGRK